ncbi:DNA translocase FtsK [Chloroflexota bacterium]
MPKQKRGKRKKERQPWWRRLLRFTSLAPVRRIILLAFFVALLLWARPYLSSSAAHIRDSLLAWFGMGTALVAAAVVVLGLVLWRRRSLLLRWWNQWLGSFAFASAAMGLLAFLRADLGGSLGQALIGAPDAIGIMRLVALVILGFLLVVPKGTWLFLRDLAIGLWWGLRGAWWLISRTFSWLGVFLSHLTARATQAKPPRPMVVPAEHAEVEKPLLEPEKPRVAPRPPPVKIGKEPQTIVSKDTMVLEKEVEAKAIITVGGWQLPPLDILDQAPEVELGQADNERRARLIEEALASYGVEVKVAQINTGPAVTQFGVEPGWDRKYKEVKEKDSEGNISIRLKEVSKTRVKVDRISSLASDLALALAAPSIRIEAPVPGKSIVGIEVPNSTLELVTLRGVIGSTIFQKLKAKSRLALALGKGAGGEVVVADLAKMPHLLIAGATGSGKTVCLNALVCCLLLHSTPDEVRFIMIDPKRVELVSYNSIPHLIAPVTVDSSKAVDVLRWLNQEMDQRYKKLASAGARTIEDYNRKQLTEEPLPYLVLIIDELADVMMTAFEEVERTICRLAQLARATGIHIVIATQRPSVDVVTGLIKANFPTRISFAVASQVDSRTILDCVGAERLLGRGDMLYLPSDAAKPKRLQGCLLADVEIERLVHFWNSQRRQEPAPLKLDESALSPEAAAEDPFLDAARHLALEHGHISASFLQRRLRIGYPRAARIMEQLDVEREDGTDKDRPELER